MMSVNAWREVRIGDLGEIFTGRTPPTEHSAYFGIDFPFITPGDMRQGKFVRSTQRGLSHEGADLLARIKVPANSVCVSCIGWQMGEVIMTAVPSFTNQQINTIVPNTTVDPSFLYYLMRPRKQELLSLGAATGVRTPILNKSTFSDLKVRLPRLTVQRRITATISVYDELIENSQRRIRLLEALAHTLYREWFADFRFPGHEKVKLVDSALGKIPEGWEVKKVGDAFKAVLGGTPSRAKPEFWEAGTIPWINSGKINDLRITAPSELITELALELSAAKLMPKGTTVIAITGATLGQVSYLEIETTANQSVIGIVDGSGLYSEWIYLTVTDRIEGIINHASGGAQQHINKEVVNDVLVVLPSASLAKEFKRLARPMFREVATLLFQIQNLRQTRDLLLPRLLSGQIELDEAEIEEQNVV